MTRPAHVVVDARMAGDGGIGTYIRNLVPRIAAARPEWTITALGDPGRLLDLGWPSLANVKVRRMRTAIYGAAEQFELRLACPAAADLFWAPHYNVPLLLGGTPLAVTIHDVCHLAMPETAAGPLRQGYARFMLRAVQQRAAAVLFDSEFSRREMEAVVGPLPAGITGTVVRLAVDAAWTVGHDAAPERPLRDPYFLYVGNLKRHKNVPLLLRAFGRIRDVLPHRLVIAGRREGLRADPAVGREARSLGDRVVFAGEIPIGDLRRYVVHAEALVTASLYEGFGLPPLEAMAAGCPCIVSSAGSLPETCGEAALYCDPRDEASVAERMLELAANPELRARLVAMGRERAALFSWDRSAIATAEVLDSVMAKDSAPRTP